jgi:YHS domain-containing protein
MKYLLTFVAVAAVGLVSVNSNQAGDKKGFSAKCPVSGKAAQEKSFVEFNGGKVYFCCDDCPKEFTANKAKYTVKANGQLVATKQAKQTVCPFTGMALNADTATKIDDVTVCVCCEMCKAKVDNAPKAQLPGLFFSEKPFKKAFEVSAKK